MTDVIRIYHRLLFGEKLETASNGSLINDPNLLLQPENEMNGGN